MVSASDPLPVSATIDTTGLATDATDTNTATIAGAVSGTEMQVDVITMPPVTVDTTGLATTATDTNTGTIAGDTTSIDAKIPALGQALAAASVPVVLPAAQITTLTPPAAITGFATSAKQDTIIGHVDGIETSLSSIDGKITAVNTGAVVVSSSALPSGAATAAKQPALGTAGTASADVITVQGIASMTALKVDGSAVTQPVSGTVAVTNAGITTIAGAVSGTEMQVDVLTMPTVTVTATNLDVQSGGADLATSAQGAAIQTAVEIIDNAISGSEMQVDVVAALPAGTNNIGDVDVLSVPRSLSGPGQPGTAIDSYTQAAISAVTGANQSLIAAPGANKQIWVYGIGFTCSVAGTVAIQDEDDTAITGVVSYAQYSGPLVHPSGNFSMPLWKVATNKALEADVTTATINGWINYAIVSV